MTFIVADRVQETTNSPGTGTATLLGAVSGYQSFSTGIGANNTTFYVIADQLGTNWEVGLGALNSTGTVLTRTTVYSSSNGGSTVNFATGTQYVWCDFPASKSVIQGTAVNFSSIGAATAGTGAFTTLSASSTVSGAGFSNYFASPPTIGNTTPNTGAFTNLSYTGTLTGSTGIVNLGSGQFYKDASGNVGIGTSNPVTQLQVTNSFSITNTSGVQYLLMGNQNGGGTNLPAIIQGVNGNFQFGTGDSWASSSGGTFTGTLSIQSTGNLAFTKSNAGIVFSNSSALTNSTLNDYETGSWTPTDQSGAGLTFSSANGAYTKIGNIVTLFFNVTFPTTASTAQISIGGFPFTSSSSVPNPSGGVITFMTSGYSSPIFFPMGGGATKVSLYTTAGSLVQNVNFSGAILRVQLTYQASF